MRLPLNTPALRSSAAHTGVANGHAVDEFRSGLELCHRSGEARCRPAAGVWVDPVMAADPFHGVPGALGLAGEHQARQGKGRPDLWCQDVAVIDASHHPEAGRLRDAFCRVSVAHRNACTG